MSYEDDPLLGAEPFPCPACGFRTFSEPSGSFDICPVCGWEDDHVQLAHPRLQGGANGESLLEAQLRAIQEHPLDVQSFDGYQRDPDWRLPTEAEAAFRDDAPLTGVDYFHAARKEEPSYYWRKPRES